MKPAAHVYVLFIRTTPQALWDAITQPEFTRRYFHQTAIESDWKVGSPVRYMMENGSSAMDGQVLACDPPRKLSITWAFCYSPDVKSDPPSRVTFEIEPAGELCKLTVLHDEFESETNTYKAVGGGWPAILSSLKSMLETGEALRFPG